MREEKGVAIVAFKQSSTRPRFLVLKRKKNWEGWELPKGHLEDEDYENTVKLELQEEAGIPPEEVHSLDRMDYNLTWEYGDGGETVKRIYRAFLVEVDEEAVVDVSDNPHEEHEKGHFFRLRDAEALLTYEDHARLLRKAAEEISSS